MKRIFLIVLSCCLGIACSTVSGGTTGGGLPAAAPESVGMDSRRLAKVDGVIEDQIARDQFPGAVLAVARKGKLVYLKAYGNKQVMPDTLAMTTDVVFDMASVSKCVGTTLSIMHLLENGRIRLQDRVAQYIPGFDPWTDPDTGKKTDIRIVDLLTHTSGLPPYGPTAELVEKYGSPAPEGLMDYICHCRRDFAPTTDYQYSCLNFITLQNVLQNITGELLCDYAQSNIFDVLGLKHTMYRPSGETLERCCPTELQKDGKCLIGSVHDPLARLLNDGNSGNAGVFSCAEDLALLGAAIVNGGEILGRRVLAPLTVACMARVPREVEQFGRALGWDSYSPATSNNGNTFRPTSVLGHSGYTGTNITLDLDTQTVIVFLTNRCHPYDDGSATQARARVANVVAASILDLY